MANNLGYPAAVIALVVSCGSVSENDPANPDAGVTPDTVTPGPCAPTAGDVGGVWDVPASVGTLALSGTIRLPGTVAPSRRVDLFVQHLVANGFESWGATTTAPVSTSTVSYHIDRIVTGSWKVCAQVDVDGNGSTWDPGDYFGCYGGTPAAPVKYADATPVSVLGCHSGVDFSLGVKAAPCLPGAYDVDGQWEATNTTLAIAGEVTLPATLPAGTSVLISVASNGGTERAGATLAADRTTVSYRFWSVPDGTWSVCFQADVDGNGSYEDAGVDYRGCYAAPVQLGGQCHPGTDIAAVVMP